MAKYGKLAQEKVHKAMKEMKEGKLKSGKTGKTVTNPKQAVAIGLSEARERGAKVPAAPKKSASSSKVRSTKSRSTTARSAARTTSRSK